MEGGSPQKHCGAGNMAETEDPFGVQPAVGDDTKQAGVKIEAIPMVP